jgi:hypothetical protein
LQAYRSLAGSGHGRLGGGYGEDVVRAENDVVFAANRDLGATVLAVKDNFTDLNVDGGQLAAIETLARANGENGTALGLFLGAIRKDDATGRYFFLCGGFDDDSIVKGF